MTTDRGYVGIAASRKQGDDDIMMSIEARHMQGGHLALGLRASHRLLVRQSLQGPAVPTKKYAATT